jgi:hypothetical protein
MAVLVILWSTVPVVEVAGIARGWSSRSSTWSIRFCQAVCRNWAIWNIVYAQMIVVRWAVRVSQERLSSLVDLVILRRKVL